MKLGRRGVCVCVGGGGGGYYVPSMIVAIVCSGFHHNKHHNLTTDVVFTPAQLAYLVTCNIIQETIVFLMQVGQ